METPPPTDSKAGVQLTRFITATLPRDPESTELLLDGQASINCGSGGQERGVTIFYVMTSLNNMLLRRDCSNKMTEALLMDSSTSVGIGMLQESNVTL